MKSIIRSIKLWFWMWRINSLEYDLDLARSDYQREQIRAALNHAIDSHRRLASH